MAFDPDKEPAVLLEEIAARAGGRLVEHVRTALEGRLYRDWAGRLVTDATTARQYIDAYERERAEAEDRRRAFDEYTERWGRRWAEVYGRALAEAREREVAKARHALDTTNTTVLNTGQVALTPAAQQAIWAHAAEAAAEWERRHPRAADPDEYFANRRKFDKMLED